MISFACPQCQSSVELPDDWDYAVIACPHCGVTTNLLDAGEAADIRPGDWLLHFELVEELGSGGNGVVWRAHDHELVRDVAIKFPSRDVIEAKDRVRFLREASLAARVKHPNIVPILHVGEEKLFRHGPNGETEELDKRLYIVSELIVGRGLNQLLQSGRKIPPSKAARLIELLADGLGTAHSVNVIHRDVKPSNVMIDAKGRPHLLDFGISKTSDLPDRTISREGAIVGSPFYLSPEQARGENTSLDVRTDVYSLGAVLFELLTGQRTFSGNEKEHEHATADMTRDVLSPRLIVPTLPRDLETICRKCLEKNRDLRFANGKEVSAELRRFREGMPILSRPIPTWERATRWCRRKPLLAGLTATLVIVTLAGLVVSVALNRSRTSLLQDVASKDSEIEKKDASLNKKDTEIQQKSEQLKITELEREHQAAEAARKKREAYLNRYIADMRQAREYWVNRELNNLNALLREHLPSQTKQADARGFEWYYWWGLLHGGDPAKAIKGESTPLDHDLLAAAFSADGQWLAVGLRNRGLMIVRTSDGHIELNNQRGETCHPIAISRDGQLIATGSGGVSIRVWNRSGREVAQFSGLSCPLLSMIFSPDGRYLASSAQEVGSRSSGDVVIWDIENAQPLQSLRDPRTQHLTSTGQANWLMQNDISCMCFSADSQSLWTSGGRAISQNSVVESLLSRWSVRSGMLLDAPRTSSAAGRSIVINPEQQRLWLSTDNIEQWSLNGVVALPNAKQLSISIPPNTQGFEKRLPINSNGILSLSPDGKWIVTATVNDEVVFVESDTGQVRQSFKTRGDVKAIIAHDEARALTVDRTGIIREWKVGGGENGERLQRFAQESERQVVRRKCVAMRFIDEQLMAVDLVNGTDVAVRNESSEQLYRVSIDPQKLVPRQYRLSQDGRRLLFAAHDRVAQKQRALAIDYLKNAEVPLQEGDAEIINAADGLTMFAWSGDHQRRFEMNKSTRKFEIQHVATGQPLCALQFHEAHPQVRTLCLNHDGSWVYGLPNNFGSVVTVWDGSTGEIVREYRTRGLELTHLAISQDGRRLAAAGDLRVAGSNEISDGGIRIWDTEQHEEILSLSTGFPVAELQFSRSGRQLVARSILGSIVIWRANSDPTAE